MNHIAAGFKSNAKIEKAKAVRAFSGKSSDDKNISGQASEANGTILEVSSPTAAETQDHRGHAYSKGLNNKSDSPPPLGEWNTIPNNIELLEGSTDLFKRHFVSQSHINKEEVAKACRILERMLTGQSRHILSDSPSKRISMRHIARGEIKFNKREDFSRGAMNIDMVVDCSGSMSGHPIKCARSLISALSKLAVKGLVTGRIIFSSGEGWMACPLPMKEETIGRVQAFSNS